MPNLEVKSRDDIIEITSVKGQILYDNNQLRIPMTDFLMFGNHVHMWGTLPVSNQGTQLPSISDSIANDTKISVQSSNFRVGPMTRFFFESD